MMLDGGKYLSMFLGGNDDDVASDDGEHDDKDPWKYGINETVVEIKRPDSRIFKAREIPKEVKIEEKDTLHLEKIKDRMKMQSMKKSSMNLAALVLTLDSRSNESEMGNISVLS